MVNFKSLLKNILPRKENPEKTLMANALPCSFALGHLNHQLINSRVSTCFRCTEGVGDFRHQKLSEIINSEKARNHRLSLMTGQWPKGCRSCEDFEKQGVKSTRHQGFERFDPQELLKDYDFETGSIKKLRSIEIRFGNKCNLACRHCHSLHSSRWEMIYKKNPDLLKKFHRFEEPSCDSPVDGYFEDILENIVPGLEEIMFSGGEVFFQEEHYKFLSSISQEHARNIELAYVTNGTIRNLHGWNLAELWKKFKAVSISVSVDGIKERFEYFRVGARWKDIEENIDYWKSIGCIMSYEVTCSVYQVFYLIEIIEFLYERNPDVRMNSSLVQYPPVINPRIIPKNVKQQLKEEWDEYLLKITDPRKKKAFLNVGQPCIDYMMGEDLLIYDTPKGYCPNWNDFEDQARNMDTYFKTNIEEVFPKISKTFGK